MARPGLHPKRFLYFAACLRRSAQRRFIASAIALRPSGLSLRFVVFAAAFVAGAFTAAGAFTSTGLEFLLPFGRPRRPVFTGAAATTAAGAGAGAAAEPPVNTNLACCSFAISSSICAMTSLIANSQPPMFSRHPTGKNSARIVRAPTNITDDTEMTPTYQITKESRCIPDAVILLLRIEYWTNLLPVRKFHIRSKLTCHPHKRFRANSRTILSRPPRPRASWGFCTLGARIARDATRLRPQMGFDSTFSFAADRNLSGCWAAAHVESGALLDRARPPAGRSA